MYGLHCLWISYIMFAYSFISGDTLIRYTFTVSVYGGTEFGIRYASYKRTVTHLDFPEK
jgi:hypothetical protein